MAGAGAAMVEATAAGAGAAMEVEEAATGWVASAEA